MGFSALLSDSWAHTRLWMSTSQACLLLPSCTGGDSSPWKCLENNRKSLKRPCKCFQKGYPSFFALCSITLINLVKMHPLFSIHIIPENSSWHKVVSKWQILMEVYYSYHLLNTYYVPSIGQSMLHILFHLLSHQPQIIIKTTIVPILQIKSRIEIPTVASSYNYF